MRTTILGLGNILFRDEGFGVHFLNEMEKNYLFPENVKLVDGGTLGYGLLDTISSCDRMLVIDIIKSEDQPGCIYRFTQAEMELHLPTPTSAHEVEFFDVLLKVELMNKLPETIFLCITPQEYVGKMDQTMTPLMYNSFPAMEKIFLKELAEWQVTPTRQES